MHRIQTPYFVLFVLAVLVGACGGPQSQHSSSAESQSPRAHTAPEKAENEINKKVNLAVDLIEGGQVEAGEAKLLRVVGADGVEPNHREANLNLALLLTRKGDRVQEVWQQELADKPPTDPLALLETTRSPAADEFYQAAQEHVERVLAINPDDIEALVQQAMIHSRKGDYHEAFAAISHAMDVHANELEPDPTQKAQLRTLAGHVWFASGNLELARVYFAMARLDDDQHVDAIVGQAMVALQTGESEMALKLLSTALDLDPGHRPASLMKAEVLLAEDKVEEVERHYEAMLVQWPNDPVVIFNLAVLYEEHSRDLESASRFFELLASTDHPLAEVATERIERIEKIGAQQAVMAEEQERIRKEMEELSRLHAAQTGGNPKGSGQSANAPGLGDAELARLAKRSARSQPEKTGVHVSLHWQATLRRHMAAIDDLTPSNNFLIATVDEGIAEYDVQELHGNLLILAHPDLQEVRFPNLRNVEGRVEIIGNPALETVSMPALQTVGGSIFIADNIALAQVPLEGLNRVGGNIILANNPVLARLDVVALQRIGGKLSISDNPALAACNLAQLESVGDDLELIGNDVLQAFAMPNITGIGGSALIVDNLALTTIRAGKLKTVTGDFAIALNDALADVRVGDLEQVGGDVSLEDNPALPDGSVETR